MQGVKHFNMYLRNMYVSVTFGFEFYFSFVLLNERIFLLKLVQLSTCTIETSKLIELKNNFEKIHFNENTYAMINLSFYLHAKS